MSTNTNGVTEQEVEAACKAAFLMWSDNSRAGMRKALEQSRTSDAAGWQPTTAALTALKQFSQDNLPADTLYTLAAIGLLYKNRAGNYSITDYGNSVLAAAIKP